MTATTRSQVRAIVSSGRCRWVTPALLTRISSRPSRVSTAATVRPTLVFRATSTRSARPRRPSARTAADVAPAGSRSAAATSAPSRARASAIARPMPRAAPVTSATWPVRSVGRENDLPEVIALLELAVRLRRRRQRKHRVDHGLEQPGRERAEQRAELPGGADEGAVQRLVLAVELEERQHDVVARRVAADHEAAAPGERPEALGPGRGADVVDDDVRAPAAGEPSHLVRDALLMVVDRVLGAEGAGPLALGDRQVTPRARARRDLARDVRAEDVGQPLLAQAAAYPDVPTVERTGPHADEDLAGRRPGIRPLAELDDLGAPVPLDHGGPHRGPPTASTTPPRP